MALDAYVGSFNIDSTVTATNTQSVTGVGFEPKFILFWWSGSTATSDSVSGATIRNGFGAAISSTERGCHICISIDGQATSDSYSYATDVACIYVLSDTTPTVDGIADFSSMDADGFTLVIDDQFTADYRISYLALGGADLTNYKIGQATFPSSTGNDSITGVGFQPDALIPFGGYYSSIPNGGQSIGSFIGMATGASNEGVVAFASIDNQATTRSGRYGYNGEITAFNNTYGVSRRSELVSFDADGYTLNILETPNERKYLYIALKGGQYSVGDITTRTDSNDISETVGFQPVALLFVSANMAVSTQNTESTHARWSIGAASATDERAVQAFSDENNLADTETAYTNQDDAVYAHVVDDAIEALMDIKSFDASGFTCVMDDTETSACWVSYLAIGNAAAAGTEGPLIGGKLIGDGLLMGGVLVK